MNTPLSAPAFDPTAPSVSITSPAERRGRLRQPHDHRRCRRRRRSGRRAVLSSTGPPVGPEDTAAPYAANWDTRADPQRRAHADGARSRHGQQDDAVGARQRDGRQQRLLPEPGARDRLRPPDDHRVPPRRPNAGRRAGGQDQGSPAAVHDARPDPLPPDHEHRPPGCAAGHLRHRPRSRLRHQPLLLRLLHARDAEPSIGCRGSRRTRRSPARCRGASWCSTRIRRRRHRAPRRRHQLRQRREALLHDRRALPGDAVAGPEQPARQGPPHRHGRLRADSTTRSTTAPGPNWDSVWAYGLRNPFRAYYDSPDRPALHRRRRRQRRRDLERGARTSAPAAPTTAGRTPRARARRPARARSTTTRTTAPTPRSRAGSSTTAPSSRARCEGNYFFADYAQHWIKRMTFDANGNVSRRLQLRADQRQPERVGRRRRLPDRRARTARCTTWTSATPTSRARSASARSAGSAT